ncbi:MAG: N-acetylglucosamine-6-phosphate deacetylase [Planctomycetota bacterium]|nr:N-acetylglucosamine-6-phosphate deacetylase [Planctomycetota bacterium]
MNTQSDISVERDQSGRVVRVVGPGLVDLQINGYAGTSFNHPPEDINVETLRPAFEKMRRRGVVAILATVGTAPMDEMLAGIRRITSLRKQDSLLASMIAGFHIEGPMISSEDGPRGAHEAEYIIAPNDAPGFLDDLQDASGGTIRIFTLAPELPGAMELIARADAAGIVVALGHLNADAGSIDRAVRAGAKMCTHLGNGSHAMLPRLDNYVQYQLADDRLAASFIADGHHVPFPTLKNFIRAKTPQRSVLITDAIIAADMPPGYTYGHGRRVRKVDPDGAVRLPGTPYLAGSALTLDMAVVNTFRNCDVPFETAWAMASTQPAELVGLPVPEMVQVDVTDKGFTRH